MCGGGSSGAQPANTTTTTQSAPWAEQKPFLERGFAEAEGNVLERPLEYFPGSTVNPLSIETEAGLGKATQRAVSGSSEIGAASGELQRTLGGDYLSAGNPYNEALANQVAGDVGAAVDSRFSNAGRLCQRFCHATGN